MSVLEFVAALVQALAWPIAAVVIAVVFRRQIRSLLSGPVRKVKAGPFEVEWDRVLSEAETELGKPAELGPPPEAVAGSLSEELLPVADSAPAAAVLEAYARVERELRRMLEGVGVEGVARLAGLRLARAANEQNLISRETVSAIEGMGVLRNLTAHKHGDVSREQAVDYLALADAVLFAITRASRG